MEARDIILRPVITEASTDRMDDKKYTFDVDLRANKNQVKNVVEEVFGVKVKKNAKVVTLVSLRNVVRQSLLYQMIQTKLSYSLKNNLLR